MAGAKVPCFILFKQIDLLRSKRLYRSIGIYIINDIQIRAGAKVGMAGSILEANKNFWGGVVHKGAEGGKNFIFNIGKDKEKQPKPKQWKH